MEADQKLLDYEEQIAARHKGDALFEWFQKSSSTLWNSIKPVQKFFRAQMKRGKYINNPFLGITFLLTIFVTGILTVGFFSLIVVPILQIILVIVALIATLVRAFLKMVRVM